MDEFTYEQENIREKLELYEWDNVWWEQANRECEKRVLYVGDSISCGIRRIATEMAKGRMLFDGFGTSKALDNPFFKDSLRIFAKQQGKRSAIIFNNGLHGWHLDDETEYPRYYEDTVKFLLEEFPKTPLLLLLTTHVARADREERVQKRNAAVLEIAKKYGLETVDLYTVSCRHEDLLTDGVHFNTEGYRFLADEILKHLDFI